jgi:hypothetical protein
MPRCPSQALEESFERLIHALQPCSWNRHFIALMSPVPLSISRLRRYFMRDLTVNAPDKLAAKLAEDRHQPGRVVRSPRGSVLSCKSWLTEAPFRMLQNNLDPEVAERPEDLVVYGGIGRAARNWTCFDRILETLRELEDDEKLIVQSGKSLVVFIFVYECSCVFISIC